MLYPLSYGRIAEANAIAPVAAPRRKAHPPSAPGRGRRRSGDGAEAEGFEPSMGVKTQTALAVRRHRPD